MVLPPIMPPFWPAPPQPPSSADPAALATLARLFDPVPVPPPAPAQRSTTPPNAANQSAVRAGGRIVGIVLPFPHDGEGPVYTPARGPARLRELLEDGIIG